MRSVLPKHYAARDKKRQRITGGYKYKRNKD